MLRDYFPTALSFIWRPDNDGQPFHDTPHDPGGATNWGVTYSTWTGWQQLHKLPVSMDAFKALGKDDFQPLYRAQFWNSIRCSSLGAIGIMMFDCAVNCGPGHAAGFLQTVLGVTVDREVGPITIAAYANIDAAKLARALCAQREDYYQHCPNAQYFCKGWDRRAEACRDYVLSLLPKPVPPVSLSPKPAS
jgi:lysozyme family protein